MGAIRATDDEQLARSLWGANCVWDEERRQYVPTEPKPEQDVETPAARRRRLAGRKADPEREA